MLTAIAFIFVFSVITMAHEVGHFLFARRAGIRVHELALGFGPRLFSIKRGETNYSLNLIPIGGYVRLAGILEFGGMEDEAEKNCPENEKYYNKSISEKFKAIGAGPLMNILLAFLILYSVFATFGAPVDISNEIGSIAPNSPAARVGLKVGDRIIEINRSKIIKMASAIETIHKSAGVSLLLTIERSGKRLYIKATPRYDPKLKVGLIGFSPKPIYRRYGPIGALVPSITGTFGMIAIVLYMLGLLVSGRASLLDLAGPVGIAQFSGQVAQTGFPALLQFTAFLSVNLGLINLLPIPALDGGRLFFVVLEAIRKKPIDIKKENRIHYIGLIFLLALMALVTVGDVFRIFRR